MQDSILCIVGQDVFCDRHRAHDFECMNVRPTVAAFHGQRFDGTYRSFNWAAGKGRASPPLPPCARKMSTMSE